MECSSFCTPHNLEVIRSLAHELNPVSVSETEPIISKARVISYSDYRPFVCIVKLQRYNKTMKIRSIVSIIITLLIASAVALYLIALDNRYKQIYGSDYFNIWTRKTVKAESSSPGKVIIEYPLLKAQYKVEDDPNIMPPK